MGQIDAGTLERELRSIVSEIGEVGEEKITADAQFVEDLGMDSMMALEVLAAIEKKYNLKIPEENLTKMTSLKSLVELINGFLKAR